MVISNVFMTFAWYGQLKLSEMHISTDWPLILIILLSWGVAFIEYIFMVPANKIGSDINGGPFNLMQLKVFKNQPIQWNHFAAMVCLVLAVFFVFMK